MYSIKLGSSFLDFWKYLSVLDDVSPTVAGPKLSVNVQVFQRESESYTAGQLCWTQDIVC